MRKLIFAALILFPVIAIGASGYGVVRPLLIEYERLNGICRGGSGDDATTSSACNKRELIAAQLNEQGWCWKGPSEDAAEYQKTWQECGPGKFDHASAATKTQPKNSTQAAKQDTASEPSKQRHAYCWDVMMALTVIAGTRDSGYSPEQALKQIAYIEKLTEEEKKGYINFLYFDPQGLLINSSDSSAFWVNESCLREWKPRFQPLK